MAQQNNLITQSEAARMLNISRSTLWRWLKEERITPSAYADGRTPLFDRDQVEELALNLKKRPAIV